MITFLLLVIICILVPPLGAFVLMAAALVVGVGLLGSALLAIGVML